jgi:hypothetical protein
MTALLRILVLAAIWVGLWGDASFANVAFGLVVAIGVTTAFPSLDGVNGNRFRPVAATILLLRAATSSSRRRSQRLEEPTLVWDTRQGRSASCPRSSNGRASTPSELLIPLSHRRRGP